MRTLTLTGEKTALLIGATGIRSIEQNIRMILTTFMYSVPLDRGFAHDGSAVDTPSPLEAARRIARLTEVLETHEPRIIVRDIALETLPAEGMAGKCATKIVYDMREGVEL